jgi:LuxR family glucitol operon transcriptional activator
MSFIQIDLVGWIPDNLKQQIVDSVVTFVADQAKKTLGDEVSQALKRLRSDAAFRDAVDQGLKDATDRFIREYTVEDEDLVTAIASAPDFWKAESVRQALLEIIQHPGVYLAEEQTTLARSFADVLRQRVNRERVDRAVIFYLHCVAESLWHLEPLRPIYELQMQRLGVERATEMVQELRGVRADVQGAMVALVQAIGEQQRLLTVPERLALQEPQKVYHNLPQPDYGTFIGRGEELVQIHRILRPHPHSRHYVVVIDGIGGIGKSALALEVAHRYLRDYDRLPPEERFEAIIWTSAKSSVLTADGIAPRQQIARTLDDIYTAISVTLEREDITRARPEEQDGLTRRALTQQRTLLVVDNMETVDDERVNAFLRELPAPTKAVVTTRHRIDVAYPIRLTGMPKEDGLALIVQECAKKDVALTETEAKRLYDHTGGVPLAIAWSVAQMGYGYGVEAVLRRLGQPSEDIARYCFEGAMQHIRGKPAHKLLMALSLFATDASREALGYVADLLELDRDDGLAELERLSLVNRDAGRFWLLPLTKQYAGDALVKSSGFEQQARKRWVQWLTDYAQKHGSKDWDWRGYRAVDLEIENILPMIEQGLKDEWSEALIALRFITYYLKISGRWAESIHLSREALLIAQKVGDGESIGFFSSDSLGWALGQLNHLNEAERLARIGLQAYSNLGVPTEKAHSMRVLGQVRRKQGCFEDALALYQEALT